MSTTRVTNPVGRNSSQQLAETILKNGDQPLKKIKDGNGFEHDVINLDHPDWAATTGMVEVFPKKLGKGINGAVRHVNNPYWSVIRDKENGYFIGIVNGSNPKTGELTWDKLTITNTEVFDLSIPAQRRKFICFKYGPFYEGSPNLLVQSKTVYGITDHQKEAEDFLVTRRSRKKASEIAESLKGEELIDMAYALGFDPKVMTSEQLYVEVLKFAENETRVNGKTGAQRFLEAYHGETRQEQVIMRRGMATGVVVSTHDKGITFNGITIGWSEEEALRYLKNNPTVAVSVDTQSRGIAKHSTQVEVKDKAEIRSAEQAEIENLRAKLAQMEQLIAQQGGEVVKKSTLAMLKEQDPEYAELLIEADALGMKGAHLIGSNLDLPLRKEKLRGKVNELKN